MATFKNKTIIISGALLLTAAFSLLPALLWFTTQSTEAKFTDISSWLTSLGQLSGLVGLAMMSVVIILSSRPIFLDRLFSGLDKLYKVHRNLGVLAFLLLLFHPLALAASYLPYSVDSAAQFLLPGGGLARDLGLWGLLGMMVFIPLAVFAKKIKYQIAKFYHRLLGAVFIIGALHTMLVVSDVSRNFFIHWYLLVLLGVALAAFTYKTLLGRWLVRRYVYFVKKIEVLAAETVEITMTPAQEAMPYAPGQFAFVSFINANIGSEPHPFSFSSSPEERELKILVKALGDYTRQLPNLSIGSQAEVEGAFGALNYTEAAHRDQLWIAGGSGLAPFLGMARDLKNTDQEYKVDLYCCVGAENELVCYEELARIKPAKGIFRFIPFYKTQYGRLDADKIQKISGELRRKEIFLCGPPAMVINLKAQFARLSVPKSQIHSEEFKLL